MQHAFSGQAEVLDQYLEAPLRGQLGKLLESSVLHDSPPGGANWRSHQDRRR